MISEIEIVQLAPRRAVVVSEDVRHDQIGSFIGRAFGAVMSALQAQGLSPSGMPFARYDMNADGFHVEAGFPCEHATDSDDVQSIELPGGSAAQLTHTGPYEALASAYQALEAWMGARHLVPTSGPWESYLDGPEVPEPRTLITWPCSPA